jgi:hypothetical protein
MGIADPEDAWVAPAAWDACVDDSLPSGVVVFQDRHGHPWRFPLVEFPDDTGDDLR